MHQVGLDEAQLAQPGPARSGRQPSRSILVRHKSDVRRADARDRRARISDHSAWNDTCPSCSGSSAALTPTDTRKLRLRAGSTRSRPTTIRTLRRLSIGPCRWVSRPWSSRRALGWRHRDWHAADRVGPESPGLGWRAFASRLAVEGSLDRSLGAYDGEFQRVRYIAMSIPYCTRKCRRSASAGSRHSRHTM